MSGLRPVILLGAARSGTTLLGNRILASDPRIAYTGEINFVWRYGQPFFRSDLRTSAAPRVRRYIRKWFESFAEEHEGDLVLDKTPANCLRVRLIAEVFPGARLIHIVRDGRAATLSAMREWQGVDRAALDSREVRTATRGAQLAQIVRHRARLVDRIRHGVSLASIIAELHKASRTFGSVVDPGRSRMWGPVVPGLRELMRELPLLETCAFQWEYCVRMAHADGARLFGEQYLLVRYEDLLADPTRTVRGIYRFLNRDFDEGGPVRESLGEVVNRVGRWRERARPGEVAQLEALLEPTLEEFGYEL